MDATKVANSDWHIKEIPTLLAEFSTTENGLTQAEVAKRLKIHGLNSLPRQPSPTWWQVLGRQFKSPLIYILVVAAVVSTFAKPTNSEIRDP